MPDALVKTEFLKIMPARLAVLNNILTGTSNIIMLSPAHSAVFFKYFR